MTTDIRLTRWTTTLASPCADPRAHPSFDLIRAEMAKLESPTGGATDWAEVLRIGDAFLAETGRDLVVASALACALAHRENVSGIALGARLLSALLVDPSVSPARARARANAISSFVSRAEVVVESTKDRSREGLVATEVALGALDSAAKGSLGDDAPSVRTIRDRVRAAIEALPTPMAASPPPVFAPPPPLPSTSGDLPDRAEQVPAFVRRVASQLVSAAALARTGSPLDPHALRLTLVALYLPITTAPETTRDARTALTAPPKLVLESLAKQAASGVPEVLVRDVLAALERNRFALDLHVGLARALERAGAAAAVAIHRHEVRGLLARVPELLDREFADGTAFASPDARAFFAAWEPAVATTTAPDASSSAVDDVRALARAGRPSDALATGARMRAVATSGRERFELTLAMAAVAEDAQATALAAELHAALIAELDRHAIDAWDPALATAALRSAQRVLSRAPGHETTARGLFARLAQLDPRSAFEISSIGRATPQKPGR